MQWPFYSLIGCRGWLQGKLAQLAVCMKSSRRFTISERLTCGGHTCCGGMRVTTQKLCGPPLPPSPINEDLVPNPVLFRDVSFSTGDSLPACSNFAFDIKKFVQLLSRTKS